MNYTIMKDGEKFYGTNVSCREVFYDAQRGKRALNTYMLQLWSRSDCQFAQFKQGLRYILLGIEVPFCQSWLIYYVTELILCDNDTVARSK